MTVTSSTRVVTATGNGATTVWPYNFEIPTDTAEVTITTIATNVEGAPLNPSLYTLAGEDDPNGGTVTYPLSGDPLSSDFKINIKRTVAIEQTLDLTNQSPYFPEQLEEQLDLIVMGLSQVNEAVGRAVKVDVGSSIVPADLLDSIAASEAAASSSAAAAAASETNAAVSEANAAASAASVEAFPENTFTPNFTGAVAVTARSLLERVVTPEMFGAVGDGVTDDILALEKARDHLIATGAASNTGGTIQGAENAKYAISRDFVIADRINFRGAGSRSTWITGLSSGVFTDAICVNGNGADIFFSSGFSHVQIRAPSIAKHCLLVLGAQENCEYIDLVLLGSSVAPLKLQSIGSFTGGAVGSDPVHKPVLRGLHVITSYPDLATPTNGIDMIGVNGVRIIDTTVSTPGTLSDLVTEITTGQLGAVGVNFGQTVQGVTLENVNIENFLSPIKVVGPFAFANAIKSCSAWSRPTLPGGEVILTVAAGCEPFTAENLRNRDNLYANLLTFSGPAYTVAKSDVINSLLRHASVEINKKNAYVENRYAINLDTYSEQSRLIKHVNAYYQPERPLGANAPTPRVDDRNVFKTANTFGTTITNFNFGADGQLITVLFNDTFTTIAHGATIQTRTGANFVGTVGMVVQFFRVAGVWYECGR